jgi:hypothetical protein
VSSVGEERMSRNRVEDFGPYQDAVRLFDYVVENIDLDTITDEDIEQLFSSLIQDCLSK